MGNILYFPTRTALERCNECGSTRPQRKRGALSADAILTPTRCCRSCGEQVEVDMDPAPSSYIACCDDCGAEDDLAVATVTLPDGMGQGRIFLCNACISRYDEGQQDPDARIA